VLVYAPTHASAVAAIPAEEQARAAADLLRLLADPTRLRLLAALTAADHDVTELTELTAMPRPAVSQHLSRLRLGGLVQARPDGRRRIYTVRNGHVRRLVTETLAQADHLLSGLPDHE
jgi:DNA-binding transcriptional ArsR family regulator